MALVVCVCTVGCLPVPKRGYTEGLKSLNVAVIDKDTRSLSHLTKREESFLLSYLKHTAQVISWATEKRVVNG